MGTELRLSARSRAFSRGSSTRASSGRNRSWGAASATDETCGSWKNGSRCAPETASHETKPARPAPDLLQREMDAKPQRAHRKAEQKQRVCSSGSARPLPCGPAAPPRPPGGNPPGANPPAPCELKCYLIVCEVALLGTRVTDERHSDG